MIPSKYLKSSEFTEEGQTVTIRGVRQENLAKPGEPDENRWIVYFTEFEKGYVLNVTAIRLYEHLFGNDTDDWKGKQIIIYNDPTVSYAGKITGGIRFRPYKPPVPKASKPQAVSDFEDDQIPF
jgi:hypothetical protein